MTVSGKWASKGELGTKKGKGKGKLVLHDSMVTKVYYCLQFYVVTNEIVSCCCNSVLGMCWPNKSERLSELMDG